MEKLLVTIEVPSVEQSFDLVVPETLTPQLLIQLLYQLLADLQAMRMYLPVQNCCVGVRTGLFCP